MPKRTSTLAPFVGAEFRYLWLATLVSNLGGFVQIVGAGWMMTTISSSHNMVALVQGAATLPVVIFSIVAGALADNYDRRRIMLVAQGLMMLISILLAACAFFNFINPWLLLTFTFLIGFGTALHNPSWHASVGDIVTRADLPAAVTLNSMGFNLTRSVGPAIGGAIVAVAGATAAFAVNAISYIPLLIALARWKPITTTRTLPRERFASAMMAGLTYVAMSPKLLAVLVRGFVFGSGAISILALLPSVARQFVAGGALTYGTMLGVFGLGAIGAAMLNARFREKLSNETIVRIACVGFALSCTALALSRDILLSHLVLLPAGACWVLALSLFNVTVQLSTPRWVVGRALSLYQTAAFGGMAGGSLIWGSLADRFHPDVALLVAGCTLLACAAIGFCFPLPKFQDIGFDPSRRFREPSLALKISPQSGPIMVMIEYKIVEKDVFAFLQLMVVRRTIRIRDSARKWSLLRDLENPEIWTECYQTATWSEYIRHQRRRTIEDAEIRANLLLLHQDSESPSVRRMIKSEKVPMSGDVLLQNGPEIR